MSLAPWVALLLAQTAQPLVTPSSSEAELSALLRPLGEAERQQRAHPAPCSFREEFRAEEVDEQGALLGWEEAVSKVERRDDLVYTLVELRRGGRSVDGRLKTKRDNELSADEKRKRRDFRTPFHAEDQPLYLFEWKGRRPDGTVAVGFQPREPSSERFKGTAVIDPVALRVVTVEQQLSQLPALLWTFEMQVHFEPTACGEQATHLTTKGSGGFLFIRKFFRTEVKRSEFRVLEVGVAR